MAIIMKLQLTILTLAAGLALSPLCHTAAASSAASISSRLLATKNTLNRAILALPKAMLLNDAQDAFIKLTNEDELTKMAYRYAWWLQHPREKNLDPTVNLQETCAGFSKVLSYRNSCTLNFYHVRMLQNAHELIQLLIDLVLCNSSQTTLEITNLPQHCNLIISSNSLTDFVVIDEPGLTSLNLSNCPALTRLFAFQNPGLTSVDDAGHAGAGADDAEDEEAVREIAPANCHCCIS